ncbi:MAG: GTPase, partial [Nitrospirae bacterium]
MALFNYATKEITLKIVYYGPGLSGKTTNLQYLHSILDPKRRGKLLSLSTEADRTLFFDFLPVELGKIQDFSIRFQLYTVPGQVRYNATRRLVLKGADAVVFVADSQREKLQENIESLENMRENLIANNINPDDIPLVLQYNKRDLDNVMSLTELNAQLNKMGVPFYESVATEGKGVKETFEAIVKLLLKHVSKKHKIDVKATEEEGIKGITAEEKEEKIEVPSPTPEPAIKEEPVKVERVGAGSDGLQEILDAL